MQNVPATITLSGTAGFKGFLALTPSARDAGTLSNPSTGTAYGSCGFGHNEPSLKTSVTFTFVPAATATSVTLSGFVVQAFATWYSVSTTLPVGANSALAPVLVLSPPPPQPPSSPPPSPPLTSLLLPSGAARSAASALCRALFVAAVASVIA